jgi:hypothetical protein
MGIDILDLGPQSHCLAPSLNDQKEYMQAYLAYQQHMFAWAEGMPVVLPLHILIATHDQALLCLSRFAKPQDL